MSPTLPVGHDCPVVGIADRDLDVGDVTHQRRTETKAPLVQGERPNTVTATLAQLPGPFHPAHLTNRTTYQGST